MQQGIYIYGAGENGKQAIKLLENYESEKRIFCGFIDKKLAGQEVLGYKCYDLNEVEKESIVIITVVKESADIYNLLRKDGFSKLYYFDFMKKNNTDSFLKDYCRDCKEWGETVLSQAEMHVADFCNLNCKGCTHFSPVFEKKLPDLHRRLNDIKLVSEKFSHIAAFYLLGGEPFLNPDIEQYIIYARKCMPDTCITIVTNGLLIPKLKTKTVEIIRENHIIVSISEYEPTHEKISEIEKVLKLHDITYSIRSLDSKCLFNRPLALEQSNSLSKLCISNGCVNVWNGKISRCPTLMYIDEFNKKFETALPNEGIMSLEDETAAEDILLNLKREVALCRHCVDNPMKWERCGTTPKVEDFAV